MTTSGLLLTLEEGVSVDATLALLRHDARVSVGVPNGRRVPVATEAESDAEAEALAESLGALPGVLFVDVICVHFEPREAS